MSYSEGIKVGIRHVDREFPGYTIEFEILPRVGEHIQLGIEGKDKLVTVVQVVHWPNWADIKIRLIVENCDH